MKMIRQRSSRFHLSVAGLPMHYNAPIATPSQRIVYTGALDNEHDLILFFRKQAPKLRHLKKLVITREKTSVVDVNRDALDFPGLTFGSKVLERLLEELGVVFTPETLHNPDTAPNGVREYTLSARWTWGHDRVM
jgi:hypothetical protein